MPIVRGNTAATQLRQRPATIHPAIHQSREVEIADERVVHVESQPLVWREPTNLDAPSPRPGFVQRWVRDNVTPDSSDANFARRFAEGWRARSPDTVDAGYQFLIGKSSGGQAVLRVGNNILCEMPRALAEQRAAHYAGKLENQMRSAGVDEMSAAAQVGRKVGMKPIHTEIEDVTPGRRRAPAVMTD